MKNGKNKMSRRKFLLKGGVAAVTALTAAVTDASAKQKASKKNEVKIPPAPTPAPEEHPEPLTTVDLTMTVNGKKRALQVPAGKTLAELLREDLGLTGVKIGCASAECGACTVLVNSQPVYSCSMLAVLADEAYVETIEGIAPSDSSLHPIQKAFIEKDALQCGYCTPGMICASKALFVRNARPTTGEIRDALSGNLCRCGAYQRIVEAVEMVRDRG